MSSGLWTAAIGGGAGLLTGAFSALIAPWAKWQVDKRRIVLEGRYALLTQWRTGVANYAKYGIGPVNEIWYEQLRPYMSSEARNRLEHERTVVVDGGAGRGKAGILAEEIDRIEREWKLNK